MPTQWKVIEAKYPNVKKQPSLTQNGDINAMILAKIFTIASTMDM